MITELEFNTMSKYDNINLMYTQAYNGYYFDKNLNVVYEIVSSITGDTGTCIQYRYDQNYKDLEGAYMYRIGSLSKGIIKWRSWKTHIIERETNEFELNESQTLDVHYWHTKINNESDAKQYLRRNRDLYFSKEITHKDKFYPNNKLDDTTKYYRGHYGILLSTIKKFGVIEKTGDDFVTDKQYKNYISLAHLDFNNIYFKKLLTDFPDAEDVIRRNVNGYFIIPAHTWINIPLKGTMLHCYPKDFMDKYGQTDVAPFMTDPIYDGLNKKSTFNSLNSIPSSNSISQIYNLTGPEESVLLVETVYDESKQKWIRQYMYISLYDIVIARRNITLPDDNNSKEFINTDAWEPYSAFLFPEHLSRFVGGE